jgi:hypothetical protein
VRNCVAKVWSYYLVGYKQMHIEWPILKPVFYLQKCLGSYSCFSFCFNCIYSSSNRTMHTNYLYTAIDLQRPGSNVSTTPITAMGCQQCLPLSVVQLKGKHCRKPHCHNGVVDTFEPIVVLTEICLQTKS